VSRRRAAAHAPCRRGPDPLVFFNGDYNPVNFLSDGQQLTGFVDFAAARFEDPAFGLAKYVTYAWLPFNVARLLQCLRTIYALSPRDWALRVALACLWALQNREHRQDNRDEVAHHLRQALTLLR
jgi:aminoglycoside phosphotransferase (APT) family kinase protein